MEAVKEKLDIDGMTSASCANSIESILPHIKGLQSAHINFAFSDVFLKSMTAVGAMVF